jgi:hypothetical protein
MATPDQIPTDLTLEIDANVTPEQFMAAARAFFGYVDEVARSIAPGAVPKWKVMLREGEQPTRRRTGPLCRQSWRQSTFAPMKAYGSWPMGIFRHPACQSLR